MSKKDKSKFKKRIKAQILQEMAKSQPVSVPPQETIKAEEISPSQITQEERVIDQKEPIKKEKNLPLPKYSVLDNLPQILQDLKKTGIVVAIFAGVIVVLTIIDLKTNLLLDFGNIIFRTFNIQ